MDSLQECLTMQLSEIEMLKSMYPTEDELHFDDPDVWKNHQRVIENPSSNDCSTKGQIKSWSFSLRLVIDDYSGNSHTPSSVTARFSFPVHYPVLRAEVFLSSNDLSRKHQSELNKALNGFIDNEIPPSEQMTLPIVDWVRANAGSYLSLSKRVKTEVPRVESEPQDSELIPFCVMWLYMHHIYNKEKRKNILQWAQELHLCGFSLPGKPGVVYVEGCPEDVNDYFIRLRRLSWQKMSCKQREVFKVNSVNDIKKFDNFREIAFDVHGLRGYHMDMGQFREFLLQHKLEYIFNELFGTSSKLDE